MDVRNGLSYDDVLLVPQRSPIDSRSDVDLTAPLTADIDLDLPIVSAPMDTVTESETALALSRLGGLGVVHRFCEPERQAEGVSTVVDASERVGAAVGIREGFLERTRAVVEAGADPIVVDVAHGHMDRCLDAVERVVQEFPAVGVVAGNVATAEAVRDFAAAGADCLRVGVGPGSHCTTREVTGAGVPQLTAVEDCARAAREHGIHTIADGGIRTSGDAVKALVAGADTVMIGGLFAGTAEAPGAVVERGGTEYKRSRGMASREANSERADAVEVLAPEGVSGLTPYRGELASVVSELAAGIRSGISYCGAADVEGARKKAKFVSNPAGAKSREGAHGDVDERESAE